MNRVLKTGKALFHLAGLSCLFASALIVSFMFARIMLQGYFHAEEPDLLILYAEAGLAVFALAYSVYLFKRFIGGKQ